MRYLKEERTCEYNIQIHWVKKGKVLSHINLFMLLCVHGNLIEICLYFPLYSSQMYETIC